MQAFLRPVMWLAVAGFFASLLVHLRAVLGLPSPFGSATWLLHIGIFVVWLPTVLVAQRLGNGAKQVDLWKAVFRGCPAWVKSGAYVVGGYAMVNFVLFTFQTTAYPKNQMPELIEYRVFSGHWMVFYYIGAATLYSAIRLGLSQRHCPQGHEVSPFANYCDLCGAPVSPSVIP
jgi:hypothetical protein